MEIGRASDFGDDRSCRSFGSNYQPCSQQSRKMSVGVLVDSVAKKSGVEQEAEKVGQEGGKAASNKGNLLHKKREGNGARDLVSGQNGSPWISPRDKSPILRTGDYSKQGSWKKLGGQHKLQPTYSAQFSNQRPSIKNGEGIGTAGRVDEQFSFSNAKESSMRDNVVIENGLNNKETRPSEALKMKLLEILGNVSSPDKELADSKNQEAVQTNLEREQSGDQKVDKTTNPGRDMERNPDQKGDTTDKVSWNSLPTAVKKGAKTSKPKQSLEENSNLKSNRSIPFRQHLEKPDVLKSDIGTELRHNFQQNTAEKGNKAMRRQSSDSIETDSEGPDSKVQRPVTRSLSRKRAPAKATVKRRSSSNYKKEEQEKNVFSFKEGWSGSLHHPTSGNGSLISKVKRSERKSELIEPHTLTFADQGDKGKNLQTTDKGKTSAEKVSSSHSGMEQTGPALINDEYDNSMKKKGKKDLHHSSLPRDDKQRDPDSPLFKEIQDQHEHSGYQSFKDTLNQEGDFGSPTFVFKTPTKNSSPSLTTKTNHVGLSITDPLSAELFPAGKVSRFKDWQASKSDGHKSNRETESSDEERELESSPPRNTHSPRAGNLSHSLPEERNTDRSEDDWSHIPEDESDGDEEKEKASPEFVTPKSTGYGLRPSKRRRAGDGITLNASSSFPKGAESDDDQFKEPPEQDQEDGLLRAVTLFAVALQRLDSKMKSITRKKSSEILISITEGIHLQMQNIESQIQTDIGKLASLGKLKRKHLETEFQEKQDQLNLIHEKFKSEITQHLQDCKSTLEGLEANQTDFKGTVERQKASHKKLLLRMEEEIDTQLRDARKRITAVKKVSRGRMLQLKKAIAECLKDGILT